MNKRILEKQQQKLESTADQQQQLTRELELLKKDFRETTHLVRALSEQLIVKGLLDRGGLVDRVDELENRFKHPELTVVPCSSCERPNNETHSHCIYCGAPLPQKKMFSDLQLGDSSTEDSENAKDADKT